MTLTISSLFYPGFRPAICFSSSLTIPSPTRSYLIPLVRFSRHIDTTFISNALLGAVHLWIVYRLRRKEKTKVADEDNNGPIVADK
jgi:hypothetical protein